MSILNNLNEEQKKAAEKINGPVLVLAGAGSGKTRALTYRIVHMVKEKGIPSEKILAITFTNKAANEMKLRVNEMLGPNRAWISTFHSFGVRILRQYIEVLGIDKNFNIYDAQDQKQIVTQIVKKNAKEISLPPSRILGRISKWKESAVTPNDIAPQSTAERILKEVYIEYQKELVKNNALDFADILLFTDRLLSNEEILSQIQDRFEYIKVDEFQDTNELQFRIIEKLSSRHKNVFVVGDEDQSIYAFRGANINNILNFEKRYGAFKCKLERNYRSTSNILNAANAVIKNNSSSMGKVLWTDSGDGEKIHLHEASDSKKEARFVSSRIRELVKEGFNYKDIAVLYRNNFQSRELEEEIIRGSIPYKVYGGMQFYQRKEIKDVLAYLSFIYNPKDKVSFHRIINLPQRGLGQITVDKIIRLSEEENVSLLEAMSLAQTNAVFSSNIKNSLLQFKNLIDDFHESAEGLSISELLQKIVDDTRYGAFLKAGMEEDRILNVKELINSSKDLNISISEYLERVSLSSSIDGMKDEEDHVKLMTVHNSKGLEFKVVFITGMEEELFPHSNAIMSNDIQEERRLFYVGMTRAEERLLISYAKSRAVYGASSIFRDRSRFIEEIPEALLEISVSQNLEKKNSEALFKAIEDMKKRKAEQKKQIEEVNKAQVAKLRRIVGFSLGDKVSHKIFGNGKVTSLSLDKVVILFDEAGEKKFLSSTIGKFISKV